MFRISRPMAFPSRQNPYFLWSTFTSKGESPKDKKSSNTPGKEEEEEEEEEEDEEDEEEEEAYGASSL